MSENEKEELESAGGANDFKAMGEKCRETCSRGGDPEVDLPKEHPLWVVVGMLNAVLQQVRKKGQDQQGGIAESQLKEISASVAEAVNALRKEPKDARAPWLIPAMLTAACLLCFVGSFLRPSPFSPEIEGLARQMKTCEGPDVQKYDGGMCGFKAHMEDGKIIFRGWKVE